MANQLFANNAGSTLAVSITDVDTSVQVGAGHGALFPSPAGGDWFLITLVDAAGALEICKCTSRSTDVLTVTRAQEGTSAVAWTGGATRVELRNTKGTMEQMLQVTGGAMSGNLDMNGNTISEVSVAASAVVVSGGTPALALEETDAGADAKYWRVDAGGEVLRLRTRTDVDGTGTNAVAVSRSGVNVSDVSLGNTTSNPTFTLLGTGKFTTGGAIELGHASDTTIARSSAGEVTIEGNQVYHAGNAPFSSGTYAPTLTATGNLDSNPIASDNWWYFKVGSVVYVAGRISINPTTASISTSFTTSIPVASTIPTGFAQGLLDINSGVEFSVSATTSGSLVTFSGTPGFTNSQNGNLFFTYVVA